MHQVNIAVVCGSGVAMAMHAAYKLRERLEKENLAVRIDGLGNSDLPKRISQYDIIISNVELPKEIKKPVYDAVPLLTGLGEEALVAQIIKKVREIQNQSTIE
jgi:PTS system galactitol-specific IIB component